MKKRLRCEKGFLDSDLADLNYDPHTQTRTKAVLCPALQPNKDTAGFLCEQSSVIRSSYKQQAAMFRGGGCRTELLLIRREPPPPSSHSSVKYRVS